MEPSGRIGVVHLFLNPQERVLAPRQPPSGATVPCTVRLEPRRPARG